MSRPIRCLCFGLACIALSAAAQACPTCRSALAEGSARWANGFALSIACLLSVLALSVGLFGLALWRASTHRHQ